MNSSWEYNTRPSGTRNAQRQETYTRASTFVTKEFTTEFVLLSKYESVIHHSLQNVESHLLLHRPVGIRPESWPHGKCLDIIRYLASSCAFIVRSSVRTVYVFWTGGKMVFFKGDRWRQFSNNRWRWQLFVLTTSFRSIKKKRVLLCNNPFKVSELLICFNSVVRIEFDQNQHFRNSMFR